MNSSTPKASSMAGVSASVCMCPSHSLLLHLSPRVLTSVLVYPAGMSLPSSGGVETKSEPTDFWMLSAGLLS